MSEIDLEEIRGTMKTPGLICFFDGLGHVLPLCDEVERLRARVKEMEETLEHGCLRCGYVGPQPKPTKGDHP